MFTISAEKEHEHLQVCACGAPQKHRKLLPDSVNIAAVQPSRSQARNAGWHSLWTSEPVDSISAEDEIDKIR